MVGEVPEEYGPLVLAERLGVGERGDWLGHRLDLPLHDQLTTGGPTEPGRFHNS